MKNIVKSLSVMALLALIVFPVLALAQQLPLDVPEQITVNAGQGTIYGILNKIIQMAFIVLMLMAILFIIWAAFKYLTAQGNPEAVETAQRMLLYAVIAIVIGLLARSVPSIIALFVRTNVVP